MLGGAGANVAVNGRTESDALQAVAKEIGDRRSCITAGDVGDFRACGEIVRSATDRFGRIDILVNNAGIFSLRTVADMEPREPRRSRIPSRSSPGLRGESVEPLPSCSAGRARTSP